MQKFINKHTTNPENVQRNRKTTSINLQDANTNLMSKSLPTA
jgi:hypothetical protein